MIGSPLYQIEPEHLAALLALVLVPIAVWLLRRSGTPRLAPIDWLLVGLLLGSAAIHAGLLIGNDHGSAVGLLFVVDAVLLVVVARRVLRGSPAGRLGVAVLLGSIVAYWLAMAGEPPDQLGLLTKLGEILALAIVMRPVGEHRRRSSAIAQSAAIVLLVVATAASSWVGAFRASTAEPGAIAGQHLHGSVPPPGTVLPSVLARTATPAERAAAADLVVATRIALARYVDPAAAAADGYKVDGLAGIDFHASNPSFEHDGRVLDPAHPEALVYAVGPNGRPVLLGAMFEMPELDQAGPTIGGPLTVWHSHENICLSLTPPGLSGVLSPLGTCPFGSILLPLTAQMIHVWIVPGVPEQFGDLDQAWRRAYLQAVAARQ